jgi:2-keto-4-pentenoate hydratase
MLSMNTDDTTKIVCREWDRGVHMPASLSGKLSFDEAYRVQLGLLAHLQARGEKQIGWKVGLTAEAIRKQFSAAEPCFGLLFESGHRKSGHTFQHSDLIEVGFENELCLTVGKALRGPGLTLDDIRQAVTHAAPALEIVENRGPFAQDIPLALADNAQQKAFVTGSAVALTGAGGPDGLATSNVTVFVNGASQEAAPATAVMGGGPLLSVVWLANKLAAFDRGIEAGQLIMAGSFTKQYRPAKGDTVEARFTPFGSVTAKFS